MDWIRKTPEGIDLNLRVIPRAKKTTLEGILGDALKIRLQAPPVDGQANKELMKFLKKKLGVPGSQLVLVSGEKNRSKRVRVTGITKDEVLARLEIGEV